jgi:hypothetical protein
MKINYHIVELRLKKTFEISKGRYDKRRSLIVSLEKDGNFGFGEASEIDYYDIFLETRPAASSSAARKATAD